MREVKKFVAVLGMLTLFFGGVFFRPSEAFACTDDSQCPAGQYCVDLDGDPGTAKTCESQGPGLTEPKCQIWFSGKAVEGGQLDIHLNAGDNGETFFLGTNTVVSGACTNFVGYCPTSNVCAQKQIQGMCQDVCGVSKTGSRMYTVPKTSGTCTVKATVFNGAGQSTCVNSIYIAPSSPPPLLNKPNLVVTGFSVDDTGAKTNSTVPVRVTVKNSGTVAAGQFSVAVDRRHKAASVTCANMTKSVSKTVTSLAAGASVSLDMLMPTPATAGTYTAAAMADSACQVSESNENDNGARDDYTILNAAGSHCQGTSCVAGPGSPACFSDADCALPPVPTDAFFQTVGGHVTALGAIGDQKLPGGEALAKNSTGEEDAGVAAGPTISLPPGALFSDNGAGYGWNLVNYLTRTTANLQYDKLLRNLLVNMGRRTLVDLPCPEGGAIDLSPYRVWCYTDSVNLEAGLLAAFDHPVDSDLEYYLFVPSKNSSRTGKTLALPHKLNKMNIVFLDAGGGDLAVRNDLALEGGEKGAGLAVIVNGGVKIPDAQAGVVTKLDGLFIFSGSFSDGGDSLVAASARKPIAGNGALLGSSDLAFVPGFRRNYTDGAKGPAEIWIYDGKYLDLLKTVLGRGRIFWQELPPE